jgi:hypothetical protein
MDGVESAVQRLRVLSDDLPAFGPAGPGVEAQMTQVVFACFANVPVGRDLGAPGLMGIVIEPQGIAWGHGVENIRVISYH